MSFWCLQFLPKNERKQVDLRYHSSKVKFIRSFFGEIHGLTICFRVLLTFIMNFDFAGLKETDGSSIHKQLPDFVDFM